MAKLPVLGTAATCISVHTYAKAYVLGKLLTLCHEQLRKKSLHLDMIGILQKHSCHKMMLRLRCAEALSRRPQVRGLLYKPRELPITSCGAYAIHDSNVVFAILDHYIIGYCQGPGIRTPDSLFLPQCTSVAGRAATIWWRQVFQSR